MYGAVRTVATTGEIWAIVIVAVLVTVFLVSAAAVAYRWQNRYHRRMRAAGRWDAVMIQTEDDVPRPEADAPGIVSTAAGRMGPAGEDIADTLPARAAVAPTRPDLPAQRAVRESERAQPTLTRPGAADSGDPGRL